MALLPPAYNTAVLLGPDGLPSPPPYHDDKKCDEAPPDYESIGMTNDNEAELQQQQQAAESSAETEDSL